MSHKGKLLRGEKWWNQRDRDGNMSAWHKLQKAIMDDVNYFLEDKKKRAEEKKPESKKKVK